VLVIQSGTVDTSSLSLVDLDVPGWSTFSAAIDFRSGLFDVASNRLYGLALDGSDIGYVTLVGASVQEAAPNWSGGSFDAGLSGPIRKSIEGDRILVGSGQQFSLDLLIDDANPALEPWSVAAGGVRYSGFREYLANAGHEAIVVDFVTEANGSGPGTDGISNGLLVIAQPLDAASDDVCERSRNRYVNPEHSPDEKVLALLPIEAGVDDSDIVLVSRSESRFRFVPLALSDADDGDGMLGIYERYYQLLMNDATDRFADPDGDMLTNVEEFQCASNPHSQDTDGDGWYDDYEVLNGTSPSDPEEF
jgi:hypothetical protein